MARVLEQAELEGAELVWLLDITWGGRTYRWATKPISVSTDSGDTYFYEGGLEDAAVELAVSGFGDEPDLQSASFDLYLPQGVDLAQEVARGLDLASGTGELALLVVGHNHNDRMPVLVGRVKQPVYGDESEPVSFTLEELPFDDAGAWPPATARVSSTTWPSAKADQFGLPYPTVWGTPGKYTDADGSSASCAATPALVIEWETSVATKADTLLIAGHRVVATSVTLYYDGSSTTVAVTEQADGLGRVVATLDISGESDAVRQASTYSVAWDHSSGGGLANAEGTGTMSGLGDVIEWWLGRSTLRVDAGAFAAEADALNAYKTAGYSDEDVVPWEFIRDRLLGIAPGLGLVGGPFGIQPVRWRWDATAPQAVAHLDADAGGWARIGRIEYERPARDVRNEIRLSWAQNIDDSRYERATILTPHPDYDDPEQITSQHAAVSAFRFGPETEADQPRVESVEQVCIYDEGTAGLHVAALSAQLAFSPRVLKLRPPPTWGWLRRGMIVTVTRTDVHLDTAVALVKSMRLSDSNDFELRLQLVEDVARDAYESAV